MRMRSLVTLLGLLLLCFAGCNRNPEAAKRKYLDNGDKYYKRGQYKEASIMYRNAIRKDPKFGEAYLKLGDTELKRGDIASAASAYRRAVELMPKNEDPAGKLADLYLAAYSATTDRDKGSKYLQEVKDLAKTLTDRDPNSYHGLRLEGFVATAEQDLPKAEAKFRQADKVKPGQPELRFALAQVLAAAGDAKGGEEVMMQITKDSPTYAPAYNWLIIRFMQSGRPADAEAIIARKVQSNPKSAELRIEQISFLYGQQKTAEATKQMEELLAKESEFPGVRLKIGDFYLRTRNFDRALQVFQEGEKKYPAEKSTYRLRQALTKVSQNQMQDALKLTELTLAEDPKNTTAISMRASLLLQSGDKANIQKAITELQNLLSQTPNDITVRYNLARGHHGRGELDAARVQYQEALKLNPSFVPAHLGVGQVYLIKADWGKAMQEAEEVLKVDPNNLAARVIKSNALINSGNLQQARTELETYVKQAPNSPDLRYQLALVYLQDKKFKESEQLVLELRKQFPNDPRLLYVLAETYVLTNRGADAMKLLQEESAKYPARSDLQLAYANTAMRLGNKAIAEAEFQKLAAKDPKNPDVFMRLGQLVRARGEIQQSLDYFRKAQQLAPTNAGTNLQLAMTLEALNQRKEARSYYQNVVKAQPDNPVALNNLAYTMAEEGVDLDQAMTYAQRAKQQMPNNDDITDTLGLVYIKKNLTGNAVTVYKELVVKNPRNPLYHYHLGMAQLQGGDKAGARQSLNTALQLKPADADAAKIRDLLGKIS